MGYKLICTDMDGTLLSKNFKISQENIDAIKAAVKKGVKVALVTGRPYNVARYFNDIIEEDLYVISTNGTYFKTKDYEYKKSLNNEQLEKIYDIAGSHNLIRHFKGCSKVISSHAISEEHPYMMINKILKNEERMEIIQVDSSQELINNSQGEILKCISFSTNIEDVLKAKEELKKYDDLEVVSSSINNFEVMPKNTSKGIAVKHLCEMLDISSDEVICIGDNENDISMIEFAGLGVAVGNATDEVKNIAQYITDSNVEHGVAKTINKFVLNI